MAQPRILSVVCLLIAIVHLCLCARNVNYNEYGLGNEKICHPLKKVYTHEIRNGSAVIVSSQYIFDRWMDVKADRNCTFNFKIPRYEGLYAVIHKMFLRRNNNGKCLDYVRFKRRDGQYTEQFCGEIDRSQTTYFPVPEPDDISYNMDSGNYDKYAEFDPIDNRYQWQLFGVAIAVPTHFETDIFISKERMPDGKSLDLSIVYTPYKHCDSADHEQYKPVGHKACIRKEYLCDKIYNCPLGVCSDEANCLYMITDQYPKDDTATKVTVGAVTTMILCFIIFVMCLWICKKSHKLCWSSDCAGPNMCSRPNSLPQDADGGPGSNRGVPTAPMLEVAVSSPVADKDLPPSYDSLFPEQSNPARS